MVDYSIAHIIYADIKHITLALAYMGDKIEEHVKNTWTPDILGDVELECSINDSKGTADAVRLLTERFRKSCSIDGRYSDEPSNEKVHGFSHGERGYGHNFDEDG